MSIDLKFVELTADVLEIFSITYVVGVAGSSLSQGCGWGGYYPKIHHRRV